MEEKNGKLIAIAKIFGTEEVLKTQFHHAKETKNAEIDALIYLGRTEEVIKYDEIIKRRENSNSWSPRGSFWVVSALHLTKGKGKLKIYAKA